MAGDAQFREFRSTLLFAVFFVVLVLAHTPLLRLPYFWDEAGYYVPAARDLLLHGTLIPRSTVSNAHPPLVMAYLALAWKIFGHAPMVTRIAMLTIAAFSLLGVFRLAEKVANIEVAIASSLCTAVYPVFFAQSSLAHVDLAAAGLTFWGMLGSVKGKRWLSATWFCLAVLAKETAILAPLALAGWELLARLSRSKPTDSSRDVACNLSSQLAPLIPLTLWYWFHYSRTGFIFGNPEFFRYNVQATLQPLRIVLALGMRLWQVFGYLNLFLLTVAALLAMCRSPLSGRERIAPTIQFAFLAVIAAYVLAMAFVGGAVLARYMLPVVPLVIIICVSTLRRRVQLWRAVVGIVALAFVVALFVNPPYGFAIEDNLAYRDYILLHERAGKFLQTHYPTARVLTAWPASDELSRPYLGYVDQPLRVLRIEDFTVEHLLTAADLSTCFDVALVFSTKYEPPHLFLGRWQTWQNWKARFFGFHRDVPPAAAAQILKGNVVFVDRRDGQWIAVIELHHIEEAVDAPGQ